MIYKCLPCLLLLVSFVHKNGPSCVLINHLLSCHKIQKKTSIILSSKKKKTSIISVIKTCLTYNPIQELCCIICYIHQKDVLLMPNKTRIWTIKIYMFLRRSLKKDLRSYVEDLGQFLIQAVWILLPSIDI